MLLIDVVNKSQPSQPRMVGLRSILCMLVKRAVFGLLGLLFVSNLPLEKHVTSVSFISVLLRQRLPRNVFVVFVKQLNKHLTFRRG